MEQNKPVENPSFDITFATFEDSGQYTCSAKDYQSTVHSQPINLTVIGGVPVVSVKDITVTIGYGHDVTLDCSIISDPPDIIVYWQKEHNGTTTNLTSNNPGIGGSAARKPSLTIKEAKEFDAGIYICFALNAVGLARSNEINLTVEGGMIYQIFNV
ncbi:cell adhesion molecule CEACAM1-like [Mytilus edulis]